MVNRLKSLLRRFAYFFSPYTGVIQLALALLLVLVGSLPQPQSYVASKDAEQEVEFRPPAMLEESVMPVFVEPKTVVYISEEHDTPKYEVGSFDYYRELIREEAVGQGVDPALAIAISRLETGNFKSKACQSLNNFGGLMGKNGLKSYDSVESGVKAFVSCIAWYNHDLGKETPEAMVSMYCPGSDDWAPLVRRLMAEEA